MIWTEDWAKKNSSVNLMTVHFRSNFEDFTRKANIQFMTSKGWFNTFKNHWKLYHIKCTGVDSGILTAITVMGCYSKEQAELNMDETAFLLKRVSTEYTIPVESKQTSHSR